MARTFEDIRKRSAELAEHLLAIYQECGKLHEDLRGLPVEDAAEEAMTWGGVPPSVGFLLERELDWQAGSEHSAKQLLAATRATPKSLLRDWLLDLIRAREGYIALDESDPTDRERELLRLQTGLWILHERRRSLGAASTPEPLFPPQPNRPEVLRARLTALAIEVYQLENGEELDIATVDAGRPEEESTEAET